MELAPTISSGRLLAVYEAIDRIRKELEEIEKAVKPPRVYVPYEPKEKVIENGMTILYRDGKLY